MENADNLNKDIVDDKGITPADIENYDPDTLLEDDITNGTIFNLCRHTPLLGLYLGRDQVITPATNVLGAFGQIQSQILSDREALAKLASIQSSDEAELKDHENRIATLEVKVPVLQTHIDSTNKDVTAANGRIDLVSTAASKATDTANNALNIANTALTLAKNGVDLTGIKQDIADNKKSAKDNTDAISALTKVVGGNTTSVEALQKDITTNATDIKTNKQDIADNSTSISGLTKTVEDNTTSLGNLKKVVDDNSTLLNVLTHALSSIPTQWKGDVITVTGLFTRQYVWSEVSNAYERAPWNLPGILRYTYGNMPIPGHLRVSPDVAYKVEDYPELAAIVGQHTELGTFSLVDMNGQFIRTLDLKGEVDPKRGVASFQENSMLNITGETYNVLFRLGDSSPAFSKGALSNSVSMDDPTGHTNWLEGETSTKSITFDASQDPDAKIGTEVRPHNVAFPLWVSC